MARRERGEIKKKKSLEANISCEQQKGESFSLIGGGVRVIADNNAEPWTAALCCVSDYACESLIRLWRGVRGGGEGGAEIATRRAQALLIKAALRPPRNAIRSSVIDSDERKRRKQPPRTFKAPRKCGKKGLNAPADATASGVYFKEWRYPAEKMREENGVGRPLSMCFHTAEKCLGNYRWKMDMRSCICGRTSGSTQCLSLAIVLPQIHNVVRSNSNVTLKMRGCFLL